MESSFHILMDDVYYEINVEKKDNYIWFAFDYGKPDPIDNKLTNINTGSKKDNPRENDEISLTSFNILINSSFGLKHFFVVKGCCSFFEASVQTSFLSLDLKYIASFY
jgi:hypothetical protein